MPNSLTQTYVVDGLASNYDPTGTIDYPLRSAIGTSYDVTSNTCKVAREGCTDSSSFNYDKMATLQIASSCFPFAAPTGAVLSLGTKPGTVYGCLHPGAYNFGCVQPGDTPCD